MVSEILLKIASQVSHPYALLHVHFWLNERQIVARIQDVGCQAVVCTELILRLAEDVEVPW